MVAPADIPAFFADRRDLNLEDYVLLKYTFETEGDPRLAVASLCSEQSTAQWKRPGRDEDFRPRHGAKAIELNPLSRDGGEGRERGAWEVTIAHPHRNFGPRIPNLLSAAAGEGPFYCPGISLIKWVDFEFPNNFLRQFEGPAFGLEGVRGLLGVRDRPIFVGVVKPNIGLSPRDFAEIAYQGWVGGLDVAKDDEMLADAEDSPIVERVRLVTEARLRAERETGRKKIFVANITDEIDRIADLHDAVVAGGANTVMINAVLTGISALRILERRERRGRPAKGPQRVPIMSHFAGTAVLSRMPGFGISSLVLTKLQRLAGADIIGLAGFGERMRCSDEEVLANIRACLDPWGDLRPSLPIPGGSDTPETLPRVFGKIGHIDFGFICGRGVFGHPGGAAAGARNLHDAWDKSVKK